MAYSKTTWVNGTTPAINATNLNNLETQYDEAMTDAFDGSNTYSGTGAGFKDEDDMASDSAVAVASQQSIKAFVETPLTSWLGGTWSLANTTPGVHTIVSQSGRGVCVITNTGDGQADVFTEIVVDGTEVVETDGDVASVYTVQYHQSLLIRKNNTAVGNKNCSGGSYYGNYI